MRIVLFSVYPYDEPTIAIPAEALARSYRRLGHETVLAGLADPEAPRSPREETSSGPVRRLGGYRNGWLNGACLALDLRDLVRGADLVHAQLAGEWSSALAALVLAAHADGAPVGASFHDFGTMRLGPEPFWEMPAFARALASFSWVTAVSPFVREEILRRFPAFAGPIEVVPLGFDARERDSPGDFGDAPARPYMLCAAKHIRSIRERTRS